MFREQTTNPGENRCLEDWIMNLRRGSPLIKITGMMFFGVRVRLLWSKFGRLFFDLIISITTSCSLLLKDYSWFSEIKLLVFG
jgi:hypothetical protein